VFGGRPSAPRACRLMRRDLGHTERISFRRWYTFPGRLRSHASAHIAKRRDEWGDSSLSSWALLANPSVQAVDLPGIEKRETYTLEKACAKVPVRLSRLAKILELLRLWESDQAVSPKATQ
jgi:hypothetical protein